MEIRQADEEKLVLNKEDVTLLYLYLKDVLIVPKYGISPKRMKFIHDLWTLVSTISSPEDFQEEKKEFKL